MEITPDSLKAEAEKALLERRIDDTIFTGQQRQLLILMMSSFACQIAARELARQLGELEASRRIQTCGSHDDLVAALQKLLQTPMNDDGARKLAEAAIEKAIAP